MSSTTAQDKPVSNGDGRHLSEKHRLDLAASDLWTETIQAAKLYTEMDARQLAQLLKWRSRNGQTPRYENGPGLVIPYFDADGKSMGFARFKPDKPRTEGQKYESPVGISPRLYIPPGCTRAAIKDPEQFLVLTEGEKKSLAVDQCGVPCVALPGVNCWAKRRPRDASDRSYGPYHLIPDLDAIDWKGRTVYVIFDSDTTSNDNVQRAASLLARELSKKGANVLTAAPDPGPADAEGKPGKVGLDDLLMAGGKEALQALLKRAKPPLPPPESRPVVVVGVEEHLAVEAAVKALAKGDRRLYQRGGELVRITREVRPAQSKRVLPSGGARIEPVPLADIRVRISRHACCKTAAGKRARPAKWLVGGVGSLGIWPGVRPLEAVTEYPVLRANGTILDRRGYDRETGLLYRPVGEFPPVPESPTKDDAARACAALLDVVADFPFARAEHQSAYLSGILTPLARFAFDGPAPLHSIDANTRGAGKGLLADTIALIVSGRGFARATYTHDNREMSKTITALALSGETLTLLDNLTGAVGGSALDAALTSTEWHGRILGKSEQPRVPLRVTWYGTSNNCIFCGDTPRRVLQIRLETSEEKPEERTGFRHPRLLEWVRQERGRLLVAALTILAAYCRAGRPASPELKPWGSFEGWSDLVRGALVWAGQPDPGNARMSAVEGADCDGEALRGLLDAWRELDSEGTGLTVLQALNLLRDEDNKTRFTTTREVLADVFDLTPGKLPSSGQLGYKLRSFCGRNCGGYSFAKSPTRTGVARWHVIGGVENGKSAGDAGLAGDVLHPTRTGERETTSCDIHPAAKTSPASPASPADDEPVDPEADDLLRQFDEMIPRDKKG
ncbi:MAG TPA: DUF3854 domain-containing protein [Gemmataceae bacterium]|nr:DUF3854 domain-containing protein [Gemmataceae bacterium]